MNALCRHSCFAFLFTSVVAFTSPARATVTNVAWYRLGENDPGATSGQVVNSTTRDIAGANHLKRFGSPVYTNAVSSDAAQMGSSLAVIFNGGNQFYSNAVATTARNNFGMEAWVRLLTTNNGSFLIAHNGNTSANGWGIVAAVSTVAGNTFIAYRGELGGGIAFGSGSVRGGWAHVAIVRDNGTSTFYLNGVAKAGTTNTTPATPTTGFAIAATPESPHSGLFPGIIDEVRVFTFAAGQFSTNDFLLNQASVATQPATDPTTNGATLHGAASAFAFPSLVWFEWGTSTNFDNATAPIAIDSSVLSTNFSQSLSGLSGGDTFFFRAVESNAMGVAYGTVQSFMRFVPTTLTATEISPNAATLNGTASSFGLPTAVWFELGTTTNFSFITSPQALDTNVSNANFSEALTGLLPAFNYFFRAAASNALGVAYGTVQSFTTLGIGGFALSFDGTNDYVAVAHNTDYNGYPDLTVTAWMNTSQATGEVGIINKYVAGSLNGWQIGLANGEVRAWYIRDASNYVWDGALGLNGGFVANGQWTHVAFTVDDSGGGRLYVNGVLKDSRAWTGTPGSCTTTQELSLARYPGGAGEFLKGTLDEVAIWTLAQNEDQIRTNMNRGLLGDYELGLNSYYRLNEGTGNFTDDNGGHHGFFGRGTLINGPAWVPGLLLRPAIFTRPATAIRKDSATLQGVTNPGLTNTSAWFEWGTSTSYGNVTPAQDMGKGGSNTNFSQALSNLTEGVVYHFRAVASSSLGRSYGLDTSFFTTGTNMITPRINHTATLLPNGKVLVAGGDSDNGLTSSAELFDPASGTWLPTGSMATNRAYHTATLLLNGKVLVVGGSSFRDQSTELYDPPTGTWTNTGSMKTNHSGQTATLLPDGKVLVVGGAYGGNGFGVPSAELYDPASGSWSQSAPPSLPRNGHTATLLPNGTVLVAGGLINGSNVTLSSAEVYDPTFGTWTNTGTMTTNRYGHTATLLGNGKVLVVGGVNSSPLTYFNSAEFYDPVTGIWTATGSTLNRRNSHTATLLPNGQVFVAGFNGSVLSELFNPLTETWAQLFEAPTPSQGATATLLPNGNVLITGGFDQHALGFIATANAAEYIPATTGFWTTNANAMATGRYAHTATLLPNSLVLVAGGFGIGATAINSVELFDPAIGTWTPTNRLNTGRAYHTMTLLPSGKALVTGGRIQSFIATNTSELFDPSIGSWTFTSNAMSTARYGQVAVLLRNGKVLVAGGHVTSGTLTNSAELYEPTNETWTLTGPLNTARYLATATLLPSGKVLIAGGDTTAGTTNTCELYDPVSGTWTNTGPLIGRREIHTATLLPNGHVLVAGGYATPLALSTAETYDPLTELWTAAPSMPIERYEHTATLLLNGKVLVAGGWNQAGASITNAEVYDPMAGTNGTWTIVGPLNGARTTHKAVLLPNGKVLAAGGVVSGSALNSSELFDSGFEDSRRPQIATITSPISQGGTISINGAQFRSGSEASGGNSSQNSPTDFPLLQLRSLEYEQVVAFVPSTSWSTNSLVSGPVSFVPGYAMATVFVNAIPSTGALVYVSFPVPFAPLLVSSRILPNGAFQFTFTNTPGVTFTTLGSGNLSVPLSNWVALGSPIESSPGQFQFTDPQATNSSQRFYQVQSP